MTEQINMIAALDSMFILLKALAENAPDIARAKRQLFDAYVHEGFTEQQAIELVKGMTGIV